MNGTSQLLGIITTHFLFPVLLRLISLWTKYLWVVEVGEGVGFASSLVEPLQKPGWIEKILFAQFSLSFLGNLLSL